MVARLFVALVLGLLQLSLGTPNIPMPVRILAELKDGNGTNTSMDMTTTTTTTMKDGDMENGTKKDGDMENETKKDGDMENETKKDGDMENETKKDGDMENGTKKDGDMENGTKKDGDKKDGDMENGTKPMKSHSVKVSGTATMVVENAAEFVASPEAKKGVEKAIATKANVKPDQVEVTLSLVESEGRRLSTETVQMEYTITLPADSSSEADSVGAALVETLESIDTTELSAEIVSEVAEATGVTYVATVEALTAEDPVVEETETETVDDSSTTSSTTVTAAVVEKNDNSAGNKQSQVCVLGAALVFWQVFA